MIDPPALSLNPSAPLGVLWWQLPEGTRALSSAAVGGDVARPSWVVNAQVAGDYDRLDLDGHIDEVAVELGLRGAGIGLLTAANINHWQRATQSGISVDVTSGVGKPTFAATSGVSSSPWSPGTINIVVHVDAALSQAAAVNAVITMTEAKTQALASLGVQGTGTATDAVVVLWDSAAPERVAFCGPRSPWGLRLANATYEAVRHCTAASHPESFS